MRQAGLCVWQAHQLVRPIVVPGVTTADIDAVVTEHFRQCGAQPLFKDYPHQNRGRPAFPAATCTSVKRPTHSGCFSSSRSTACRRSRMPLV